MKITKIISKILFIALIISLSFGTAAMATVTDYATKDAKYLKLSYFRKVKGENKNAYALNTLGNGGMSHFPVFQIMDGNNTNYYCLNAKVGDSWRNGTLSGNATSSEYNKSYDLTTDVEQLKHDPNNTYNSLGNSNNLKQILWILDNIYIPDTSATATESNNLAKKRELLARAGIVWEKAVQNGLNGPIELNENTYKYKAQDGYNYSQKLADLGYDIYSLNPHTLNGWFYYNTNDEFKSVGLPDELVEVAQSIVGINSFK